MTNKSAYWVRLEFRTFISHFWGMTKEQIDADINESIQKLLDLDDSGNSFGALMVRLAKDRIENGRKAIANRENGMYGGRPRIYQEEDVDNVVDNLASEMLGHEARRRPSTEGFPTREEAADFARRNGYPEELAIEWHRMNKGKLYVNWKGALTNFIKKRLSA